MLIITIEGGNATPAKALTGSPGVETRGESWADPMHAPVDIIDKMHSMHGWVFNLGDRGSVSFLIGL